MKPFSFRTFMEAGPPAPGGMDMGGMGGLPGGPSGGLSTPGVMPGGAGGSPPMPPGGGGGMGGPDPMGGGMGGAPMGGQTPQQPPMQIKFSDVWSVLEKILTGKPLEGEKDQSGDGQQQQNMLKNIQPNQTNSPTAANSQPTIPTGPPQAGAPASL